MALLGLKSSLTSTSLTWKGHTIFELWFVRLFSVCVSSECVHRVGVAIFERCVCVRGCVLCLFRVFFLMLWRASGSWPAPWTRGRSPAPPHHQSVVWNQGAAPGQKQTDSLETHPLRPHRCSYWWREVKNTGLSRDIAWVTLPYTRLDVYVHVRLFFLDDKLRIL